MFILDSLLIGGLRFVLDKIAQTVDSELSDESHLREALLAAQMRVEVGELTRQEFAVLEADILARLRAVRAQSGGPAPLSRGGYTVAGIDATFDGDEHR